MKIYKHILCITLFISVVFAGTAFSQDIVTIAVHDYPPYYNKDGNGFMTEVYEAAFNEVGKKIDIQVYPIRRGVRYLLDGKVDAHSPGYIFFGEDIDLINWVPTFKVAVAVFYYKPNKKREISSLADLKGNTLGVLINSPLMDFYQQNGIIVDQTQTPTQLARKIRAGRMDFFEATTLTGLLLVKETAPTEWGKFDYFAWQVVDCNLAFAKNNARAQKIKQEFEKGFLKIVQNGEYIRILENYWGKGNIPKKILYENIKISGTDNFSVKVFQEQQRTNTGKIISIE